MEVSTVAVTDQISQDLDQLTAAQLSTTGQSFLSHLENGKETAQIGKVLQVLESLGIGVELILPPDVDTKLSNYHNSVKHSSNLHNPSAFPDDPKEEPSKKHRIVALLEDSQNLQRTDTKTFLKLWEEVSNSKRVRRA
ncbi:transcriptional regulator [Rheinheimera sp. UJ51]|uniref:transcriptional regulator n=1 Tax=Rheinheimera sp. UJ51 TaxID=2892446 RepID=UPI001E42DC24|nr:transcriptional regulator [Rheinheimera sp. UJ51]MCC5452896.1 transcriptional regulator [Rheinheimera sp. UJ51]